MLHSLFLAGIIAFGVTLAARADTLLAPGDVIDVQVYPDTTLTQSLTIARDGSISLAMIGRVLVGGLSTTQAQHVIARGLAHYIREPIVSVALKTEAPYDILVLGNVKTPGRYTLSPTAHITDALAAAGGLNPVAGGFPNARVSSGSITRDVSLEGLLRRGDVSENVPLANGAAVYVPGPTIFRVRVLGAVEHPGDIELNAGDRLAVAIAKAGNGPNVNADLNHIHVTHKAADGTVAVTEVNLYRMLQDGDLSADVPLATDDVVFVPESRKKTDSLGVFGLLRRLVFPW